ncbi:TolC family protein [Allorhodopirellula solitaria]|uniref:Outer membrane efflux protein n=1 Tax=Allorhodopirellula solitaria TaxID=2527987 RepID=A0A5C5XW33_9BACT|nr:hypothetical protein [Allorhodopirellula solitaria]TWT67537.1 hypothetical protein CA85_23880 [Allorhodopirellula solitaria]
MSTNPLNRTRRHRIAVALAILAPGIACSTAATRPALAVEVPLLVSSETFHAGEAIVSESVATYTLSQVMQWAAAHSPAANQIEAESTAVMRGIDTSDPDRCCAARYAQSVLQELALARRSDSATEAAIAYHQLIAAIRARDLAGEAISVQDELIAMATEAERLELPDGNPLKLKQTRLDLVDAQLEHTFVARKLRQELSRLTGRSETEVAAAIMVDALPEDAPLINAADEVADAQARRHDLRAVDVLCRDLRSCNLDAARILMSTISPGAGMSLATAATGILKCFQHDTGDNELSVRRYQCSELKRSLENVVRNETLQAILDVRCASERLKLVDEQLQFASERLDQTRGRIQIDESAPGSDLIVELEIHQLRGDRLARQKDLAVAIDNLHHATGAY